MYENLLEALRADEKSFEPTRPLEADVARFHSTNRRWEQYQNGEITEDEFREYATQRKIKQMRKELAENEAKLAETGKAPKVRDIMIVIEYPKAGGQTVKSRACVYIENGAPAVYYGQASGWGYDKSSSAVASALNKSDSVMKLLYDYKEKQMAAGLTDESRTTTTGHDNRDIIGYGAGYTVLPYFEGGVGLNCFWSIFQKLGFDIRGDFGSRKSDVFHVYRSGV